MAVSNSRGSAPKETLQLARKTLFSTPALEHNIYLTQFDFLDDAMILAQ
jgi:hypothetical protein